MAFMPNRSQPATLLIPPIQIYRLRPIYSRSRWPVPLVTKKARQLAQTPKWQARRQKGSYTRIRTPIAADRGGNIGCSQAGFLPRLLQGLIPSLASRLHLREPNGASCRFHGRLLWVPLAFGPAVLKT